MSPQISPCTYNIVENIHKVIHSDLVIIFLKVRKKNVELNFYSSDYFAYFSSGEVRRFLFAVILKFVCWTEGTDCFYEGH